MKINFKVVALAMLAAIGAGGSAASAATSVDVNLFYIGSTTGNTNTANKIAQNTGTGLLLNQTNAPGGDLTTIQHGLTQMDLLDPSIQSTANLKNYFAVYVDYRPNASTDRPVASALILRSQRAWPL